MWASKPQTNKLLGLTGRKNAINTKYMKRRKFGNNTSPIMSVLTPYRNTVCKKRRAHQKHDQPQPKQRRLFFNTHNEVSTQMSEIDPEEEVRRELGLDTDNLIEGSDGEEGEILIDTKK